MAEQRKEETKIFGNQRNFWVTKHQEIDKETLDQNLIKFLPEKYF